MRLPLVTSFFAATEAVQVRDNGASVIGGEDDEEADDGDRDDPCCIPASIMTVTFTG